jgi:hypothetical protein
MLWVSIRSTNSKVCLQPGFNLSPDNSLWALFSIHLKKKKKKVVVDKKLRLYLSSILKLIDFVLGRFSVCDKL